MTTVVRDGQRERSRHRIPKQCDASEGRLSAISARSLLAAAVRPASSPGAGSLAQKCAGAFRLVALCSAALIARTSQRGVSRRWEFLAGRVAMANGSLDWLGTGPVLGP